MDGDANYFDNPGTDTGGDPSNAPAAIDPSIGAQPGPVAPPPDPTAGSLGVLSGVPQDQPATGSVANPLIVGNGVQANQAPGTTTGAPDNSPIGWRGVLRGALAGMGGQQPTASGRNIAGGVLGTIATGLAGASQKGPGRGGFLAGLGMGAGAQQRLQFESAAAADTHINALDTHRFMQTKSDEAKLDYKQKQASFQNFMQTEFGIEPNLTFNDTDANAIAAGSTLAAPNGGVQPPVYTSQQPEPKGKDGTISTYSPTQQSYQSNLQGYRDLVNTGEAMAGRPPLTDDKIAQLGFKGMRDASLAVQKALSPTVDTNVTEAQLPIELAKAQQRLATYSKSPNPNDATLKQLEARIGSTEDAIKTTQDAAASKAQAEDLAKQQTPQGQAELENKKQSTAKAYQETLNAQFANVENHQKALFNEGQDPLTKDKLNLANSPDEMLIDGNTHQPIPIKMLTTLKPTQQESNRSDFAKSTLHALDLIDKLRKNPDGSLKNDGSVPNGPIVGLKAKALANAGYGSKSQEAIDLLSFASSAATGAHVGGRFNVPIMQKMDQMLSLNMRDAQFDAAEKGIRDVMEPYVQQGGRMTVGQYKQELIGSTKYLDGKKVTVTGLDKQGNPLVVPAQ